MSSNPVIIVDGIYLKTLESYDYQAYLDEHYPGAKYHWENGYQLMINTKGSDTLAAPPYTSSKRMIGKVVRDLGHVKGKQR